MFRLANVIFLALAMAALCPSAFAQNTGVVGGNSWMSGLYMNVDSVYNQIKYEEPGAMKESGGIGGIRTEIGLPLLGLGYFSVGGSYFDGSLFYEGSTFGGSAISTVTGDIVRDVRGLFHFAWDSLLVSVGYAERYWYNDLIISYRRRTEYKYNPIRVTYFTGPFYYAFEYDHWIEGKNKSHMSDVGGGRSDVTFTQNSGKGMGLEFGRIIGGGASGARIFLSYHKWDVDASTTAFDGVQTLVEPKNSTLSYQFGAGFFF